MPRKTAAEKAAEEAAAAAEARRRVEQQRLKWVAVAIVALALFAGGFAAGQSAADGDDRPGAFSPFGYEEEIPPVAILQPDGEFPPFVDGPGFDFDRPRDRIRDDRLRCEIVERDGRTLHLVCEFPGEPFIPGVPDDQRPGDERPAGVPGFLGVGVANTPAGVTVLEMLPDSPAAMAGIEIDDVIVGFGDVEVVSAEQFSDLVGSMEPGTPVRITVLRFGSEVTVEAILGGRPE